MQWLLSRRGDLIEKEARNRTAAREIASRQKDIEELLGNQDAILERVQKITNAIVQEAPAPGSFDPLRQSGIRVESLGDRNGFEYGFSSELEFHRLVPALAALESDYPLLRITELEISSQHDPFTKAVSPLHFEGRFTLIKAEAPASQPTRDQRNRKFAP